MNTLPAEWISDNLVGPGGVLPARENRRFNGLALVGGGAARVGGGRHEELKEVSNSRITRARLGTN